MDQDAVGFARLNRRERDGELVASLSHENLENRFHARAFTPAAAGQNL